MRVLFLHTALSGLPAEYKVHLTLAANARINKLEPYFIWQTPIPSEVMDSDRIITHDFGRNMSITPKPSRYRRAGMMIRKLPQSLAFLTSETRKIRPDLIYTSQQGLDIRFASLLAKRFRIPHVIHIHYNIGPWLGKSTLKTIRKSSRLIAVSEYIRQTALLQGVSPSAVHTIVNPAPPFKSLSNSEFPSIRAEFNFEENTLLIVAVGRLDPGKGHLALFEAFSQVIRQIPNARLLVCGASSNRDNYEDRLKQRVIELEINPYTVFTGQRNDISVIMRSANVFCLPTELDPCPLVFLEAMAEGLPVVAYYSGGVPELVLHNQTGLLSYPGDIHALATNLQKVLSDKTFAQQLSEAGKKRALTEFAPERVSERWLSILQEKIR